MASGRSFLLISVLSGLAFLGLPSTAAASPRFLPFTYGYETNAEGEAEIEQYADVTPVKGTASDGSSAWYLASQFQTEFEYGISDRLELGLYVAYAPHHAELSPVELTEKTGIKQRLRLRLAESGEWPVDIALYGELVENEDEIEVEGKIILQRRIGNLRIATNLWAEFERYFTHEKALVLNPTLGASYQVTPTVHLGVEGWMRKEISNPAEHPSPFGHGPHVLVGPTCLLSFGKFWWSTGLYARVTDFGRSPEAGDAPGAVWGRSIIGINL